MEEEKKTNIGSVISLPFSMDSFIHSVISSNNYNNSNNSTSVSYMVLLEDIL